MGVALFIVPEREIDGFDHFVNGKPLARTPQGSLDRVAEEAGVRPLMQFFSLDPATAQGLYEDTGGEPPPGGFPPPEWHSAEEGLVTVRGLLNYLSNNPAGLPESEAIMADLRDFERVLSRLESEGVRWYLAVDM